MGVGSFLGGLPVIGGVAKGVYDLGANTVDDVTGWVSDAPGDFMNVGKNRFQPQNLGPPGIQYGGGYGADQLAQFGINGMTNAGQGASWAQQQAMGRRGPQAYESQGLSNLEYQARQGDQAGSLQLAREAAMGLAPSAAAFQMQAGLDQSLANQQAMVGGARGGAGLALASANQGANAANLQSQAFNAASQLRANEMAQGRQLYGQLSGQMREQDQARLGMGNQMGMFNANLNDQYRMGMGNMANQRDANALGWYNAAQNPYQVEQTGQIANAQIGSENYNQAQSLQAGINTANADARKGQNDRIWGFAGGAGNLLGQMIPKGNGVGGSTP